MQKRFWPLFIIMGAFLAAPVQAKLYKWTDDKGEVHYGDSIPAQYLNKQHDEMNAAGPDRKTGRPGKGRSRAQRGSAAGGDKKRKRQKAGGNKGSVIECYWTPILRNAI